MNIRDGNDWVLAAELGIASHVQSLNSEGEWKTLCGEEKPQGASSKEMERVIGSAKGSIPYLGELGEAEAVPRA